jgi:hypothetical protein
MVRLCFEEKKKKKIKNDAFANHHDIGVLCRRSFSWMDEKIDDPREVIVVFAKR